MQGKVSWKRFYRSFHRIGSPWQDGISGVGTKYQHESGAFQNMRVDVGTQKYLVITLRKNSVC